MKQLNAFVAAAMMLAPIGGVSATAQRYEDETPIGNDSWEAAQAWANAFCNANPLEVTGYASVAECIADVAIQAYPSGEPNPDIGYLIDLPSGAKACRYYGSPGRLGTGPC